MVAPAPSTQRYVIKGEVHKGSRQHFVDAWSRLEAAIATADAIYGYDRVVIIDTHDNDKEVWDSLEVIKK